MLLILAALGSGCGGGGGSAGGTAGVPAVPQAPGVADFTITDPFGTSQSHGRRPSYFAPSTAAIRITVNGTTSQLSISSSSPLCNVTAASIACALDVPVPNGQLTFSAQTVDANGVALSQVSGTANISGKTAVPLALQGIWKTATARLSNAHPAMGAPSLTPVAIAAYDADGALIIGPEPYSSPIPLYDSDTSGATALSQSSVTSPADKVTLAYDGKSFVNAIVSAAVVPAQATGQQDTLVPSLVTTEYHVPSGSVAATNSGYNRLVANGDGTMSFIEQGMRLGRINAAGTITETTLSHYPYDIIKGADGNLWALVLGATNILLERINADGSETALPALPYTTGPLAVGSDGNFWLPAADAGSHAFAVRVTPAGAISSFSVSGAQQLTGGVLGSDGNVWFAGTNVQNTVEMAQVTPAGAVTTYALPAGDVSCCNPVAGVLAAGPDAQIYTLISMQTMERVTTSGVFSHFPVSNLTGSSFGGQAVSSPMAFAGDGALWVSSGYSPTCSPPVVRITTSGASAMLLLPVVCDPLSGPAPTVTSFATGPDGNLWYTRGAYVGKIVVH